MNTTQKIVLGLIFVGLIAIGAYYYPRPTKQTESVIVGAPGDVNFNRPMAEASLDFSTTTPTTSTTTGACLLNNTSGRDRIITSIDTYGAGLTTVLGATVPPGLARWVWTMATSTDVYNVQGTKILSTSVSTTTPNLYVSSSTPGVTGIATTNDYARVWSAGSCLNLQTNGTTTATGVVVVGYVPAP